MTDTLAGNRLAGALALIQARFPELLGHEPVVTELSGGMTNRNYRLDTAGNSYVLRLGGNDTHLLGIDREVEHAANRRAAEVGVAPEVLAFLQPQGYLLTRFVPGVPMPIESIREAENLTQVAATLRRFHRAEAIPGTFSPFLVAIAYAEIAQQHGVPLPPQVPTLLAVSARIKHALDSAARTLHGRAAGEPGELQPCPCHNDLLNANFLRVDDQLRIVDWEYAGMGDRYFDLGNFATNHNLDDEESLLLLAAYFGASTPARFARLQLMRIMSDLREAMWGVVQQGISSIDFDFKDYAGRHFARLLVQLGDPRFEAWLHDAERGPYA